MSGAAIDRFLEQEPPRTINAEIWARQLGFGGLLVLGFCGLSAVVGLGMLGHVLLGGEVRNSATGGDGSGIMLGLGCIATIFGAVVGSICLGRRRAVAEILRRGELAAARIVEFEKEAFHHDAPTYHRLTFAVVIDGRELRRRASVRVTLDAVADLIERRKATGATTRVLVSADRKRIVWIDQPIF